MSLSDDPSDFVDSDFQEAKKSPYSSTTTAASFGSASDFNRPPSREEIDTRVSEKQVELARLKRAQEELERERASLEELRRRQAEFQTGREEMLQNLTRGIGLLQEAEFTARREAEQMAKTLADFNDALQKVQALTEQNWTKDDYNVELTRALTTLENARMEWNSARLKFAVLNGAPSNEAASSAVTGSVQMFQGQSMPELFRLGLALTWPLVLLGLAIFLTLFLRR